MENSHNLNVSDYLEYFATICLVLSDNIKHEEIKDFNFIKQHLDEMSESMNNIVTIINKDSKIFKGIKQDKDQILRDFKISKIINE